MSWAKEVPGNSNVFDREVTMKFSYHYMCGCLANAPFVFG